ncbi:hypothetical protein IKN40_04480 [bacterium]|nr:hypothetical protein [bacterium]
MKNKYSKSFENYARINSSKLTKEQLRKKLEKKYDIVIMKHAFETYLYRHGIKCTDYHQSKVRNMSKKPIGYEYVRDDGMVLIKVNHPSKWKYKQRLLYEKYHNCKLTSDDYIIFLNQDRTDFSKENLMRISQRESSILSNQKMFSKDPDLTKTGVLIAKLMIKAKEKTQ